MKGGCEAFFKTVTNNNEARAIAVNTVTSANRESMDALSYSSQNMYYSIQLVILIFTLNADHVLMDGWMDVR